MIFFIPAALFVLLGWLIKHRKVRWLVIGYRKPSKDLKHEEDILNRSQTMGNTMFFLASIFFIMAVVNAAAFDFADTVTLVGLGVASLIILIGAIALSTGDSRSDRNNGHGRK